jgi:glucose/arabinose dehydrogenase
VVLGPDGKSLFVVGGNHTKIPNPESSRVPRNWQEDQLLPRMWDAGGHAVNILAPGGWICRTDPEGKSWELYSNGYRNAYDIAFNTAGELFTYDSDMEWDIDPLVSPDPRQSCDQRQRIRLGVPVRECG